MNYGLTDRFSDPDSANFGRSGWSWRRCRAERFGHRRRPGSAELVEGGNLAAIRGPRAQAVHEPLCVAGRH